MHDDTAILRAETLVSRWHKDNRHYLGQGAGVDWQARVALVRLIAEALAEPGHDPADGVDRAQLRRRRNRGADPEAA
jgi:hypothetical protein